jgi:hypothetical protein
MSSRVKPNLAVFDRRTSLVLVALVVSMSLVSGLLLWMEPTPMGRLSAPQLAALKRAPVGFEAVFKTESDLAGDWDRVVIDHTGTEAGDLQTLGGAYHFLIGNGNGAGDGEIQISQRWLEQRSAPVSMRLSAEKGSDPGKLISVCLVGDGDRKAPTHLQINQLVKLATALQQELNIPRDRVVLRSSVSDTTSPGRLFPTSLLLQQLADLDVR